jgi:phosphatidate cytidylyltransferase
MLKRLLTGAIFVTVLISSILLGSITYYLLFSVIVILSMIEFYSFSKHTSAKPQMWLGVFTGWLFFTFNYLYAVDFIQLRYFVIFIPIFILFMINELYLYHKRPLTSLAFSFLGIIYVAVPFAMLNYFVFRSGVNISEVDVTIGTEDIINNSVDYMNFLNPNKTVFYTPYFLLGFLILIWIYDTFAYLVGIAIGKHRLFERVSPKKSWEGAIGGAVSTIGISLLFPFFFPTILWYQWMILAGLIVIFSTYGDLVESLFKRSLQIKDSGSMLPGHGGMLDRFDSVLIAAPIVFVYLQSLY